MNYEAITSRKNKTITYVAELSKNKKTRDCACLFVIEGIKLIDEAIASGLRLQSVFFTQKALSLYNETLSLLSDTSLYLVTDEVYQKLSDESAPQGILAVAEKPAEQSLTSDVIKEGGFVILEDLQNPLNIGAILRCCYSLGFEKIIFSKGCADIYSPKCSRAAMGSLFKIKAYFSDELTHVAKTITESGNRVFCTALKENSLRLGSVSFLPSDSFVIGNEGHGASSELLSSCTDSLFIPMNENAESLNAATAAALVMWEMKRSSLCNS